MRQGAVESDTVAYNVLISACGEGGEWVQAVRAFVAMRQGRVETDTTAYNSVISACAAGGLISPFLFFLKCLILIFFLRSLAAQASKRKI